jgi:hypothetical protein
MHKASSSNVALYVRPNGSSVTTAGTRIGSCPAAGVYAAGGFITNVDANQIFEYSVSANTADYELLAITGYWEYVD